MFVANFLAQKNLKNILTYISLCPLLDLVIEFNCFKPLLFSAVSGIIKESKAGEQLPQSLKGIQKQHV